MARRISKSAKSPESGSGLTTHTRALVHRCVQDYVHPPASELGSLYTNIRRMRRRAKLEARQGQTVALFEYSVRSMPMLVVPWRALRLVPTYTGRRRSVVYAAEQGRAWQRTTDTCHV